ncbi:MAG: right-handed parallel beta-helix repeat-containing protein [Planctomycetota bacterium]
MNLARTLALSMLSSAPAFAQLAPPPGPVTETDQVREEADARIPIDAGFTTISEPGSYYLTQNISTVVGASITVAVPDVTIDLNGYSIIGGPGGINVNANRVTIRNGTIRDVQGTAIDARFLNELVVEDVAIHNCGRGTILVPSTEAAIDVSSGRVERVRITDCSIGIGLFGDGTTVRDTVLLDIDRSGIVSLTQGRVEVTVEGCKLRGIGNRGIDVTTGRIRNTTIETVGDIGVDVQSYGLIENVTVIDAVGRAIDAGRNGRVINSSAVDPGSDGIVVGRGGLIENCTVAGAAASAYIVGNGGLITGSTANGRAVNNTIPMQVGIQLGDGATARDNTIFEYQETGITLEEDAVADSNTIVGNTVGTSDRAFFAAGAFIQITRNNISQSGSTGASLGASGSWLGTNVANLVVNSRIGPANDLNSPWANFVD